jgi:hypothetical protein
MARGDATKFNAVQGFLAGQNIDIESGAWKIALLNVGVDVILATETNPRLGQGNLIECAAGGGYTAGGIAVTLANVDGAPSSATYTMKVDTGVHTDGKFTWSEGAGSPTDIKAFLLYQDDAVNDEAYGVWDATNDGGTTPVSLVAGDVTLHLATGPGEMGDLI